MCSTVCEVQGPQGEDHPSPAKHWEDNSSLGFGHQYWHSHKHHTNDSDLKKKKKTSFHYIAKNSLCTPAQRPAHLHILVTQTLLKELQGPGKYGAKLEKKLEKNGLGGRWGDKAGQELQLLW